MASKVPVVTDPPPPSLLSVTRAKVADQRLTMKVNSLRRALQAKSRARRVMDERLAAADHRIADLLDAGLGLADVSRLCEEAGEPMTNVAVKKAAKRHEDRLTAARLGLDVGATTVAEEDEEG